MQVLVRVAPEINLKSPKVKAKFLQILIKNIKSALSQFDGKFQIENFWSRLLIKLPSPEALPSLGRVFGIASISPIEQVSEPDLSTMIHTADELYRERVVGKRLCVRVKRSRVEGFTSIDAERQIGSRLGELAKKIDLMNPEIKIEVEVNPNGAYYFSERIPGAGGLPLGSQGKALCLISGGFDSAVAAWRMMKRGVNLDFVFCNLAGSAYERSVLAVVKGLCQNWAYGQRPDIYVLDFDEITAAIRSQVVPSYNQVVLKRAFYRAATLVAHRVKALGLVTGEAVGQVSSQTLTNLQAIDTHCETLVMRPLLSFDKDEIIKTARDIGTYLLCEHIKEYCALTTKKPVTGARLQRLDDEEAKLPEGLINNCVATAKKLNINDLADRDLMTEYLFTQDIGTNDVIIDTRPRIEFDQWHHPNAVYLPLQSLAVTYSKFDKNQRYILLCPFGLQTAVVAESMQKLGFEAYSFSGGAHKLRKLFDSQEK